VASSCKLGERLIAILGPGGSRELLEVLMQSEDDRAALIGRLYQRADRAVLAEFLMDIEGDPHGRTRMRLIQALLAVL
jgi:hypothetical protein